MKTIIAKSFIIPAALCAALAIASCDGGSKGTDPQAEDSSGSVAVTSSSGGLQTNSSSGAAEPLSSGVVPGSSSGGTSTVSGSSGGSSGGTQVRSSSSGGAVSGSSSSAVCEEGTIKYLTLSGVRVYYVCKGNAWVAVPVSSSSSAAVSSSSAASSSSRYDMDSTFNSELSYGEFTDPRDGQKYRTIKASSYEDYEYFAENLNYGRQVPMNGGQADSTKYCYNDDPWYCAHHFGGLYRWSTAMGFPAACDSVKTGSSSACPDTIPLPVLKSYPEEAPFYAQMQGICPDGWHVMNQGEWSVIVGGGAWKIESEAGWNDNYNNTLGFSALPGGGAFIDHFDDIGKQAFFWLPQETGAEGARVVNLKATSYDNTDLAMIKSYGYSVRCVKDHEGI